MKKCFFTIVSKYSSFYLSWAFQSNGSCFRVGLPILSFSCNGLALLKGGFSISDCHHWCFGSFNNCLCYGLCHALCSCQSFTFLVRQHFMGLSGFYFLACLLWDFLPFTSDTMSCYSHWRIIPLLVDSNYDVHSVCLVCSICNWLHIYKSVFVCVYMLCTDGMTMGMSMCVIGYYLCMCYWLNVYYLCG